MFGNTSSSRTRRVSRLGLEFDLRYAALSVGLLTMSFALSSIPDLDHLLTGVGWRVVFNAMHVPMFGALAFCAMRTFSSGREGSLGAVTLAFVLAGAYAALDEWRQSFVAGRDASLQDVLVDVGSILAVLVVLYRRAAHRESSRPIPRNRQPETP